MTTEQQVLKSIMTQLKSIDETLVILKNNKNKLIDKYVILTNEKE